MILAFLSPCYLFYVLTHSIVVAIFALYCTVVLYPEDEIPVNNRVSQFLDKVTDSYVAIAMLISLWAVGHVVYCLVNSMFAAFLAFFLQCFALWKLGKHPPRF